jgi:signal transduction histidine kinase
VQQTLFTKINNRVSAASHPSALKILVLVADLETRSDLQDVLESDGHQVAVADALGEQFDRAMLNQYSAVLLDAGALECMAGDMIWELPESATWAESIFVCDPRRLICDPIENLRRDAVDYLLKPIDPAALRTSLARFGRRLSDGRRPPDEAERLAAIGETMTVLAHESRNYFQECVADVEMLERRIRDRPEAHCLVERLQKGLDRIHRLFEDTRDFAAPITLVRERCWLPDILQDVWDSVKTLRQQPEAQLSEISGDRNLYCEVDPFRIDQVFRNILDNALAACPRPARITVHWSETFLYDLPAIQVVICDNGPGIPAGQQSQIFEPFFTTKAKGTGLGLAITRRIVEAHGGRITVSRRSGPGAEFVIVLPQFPADADCMDSAGRAYTTPLGLHNRM